MNHAGISNANDLLFFLDDDILFESTIYCGHYIPIDGVGALKQLEATTSPGTVVASGVSYLGRANPAIDEHIGLVIEDLKKALLAARNDSAWEERFRLQVHAISLFPTSLPVRLNLLNTEPAEFGPGISGAVLATTPASLFSHGLPRCYNEDRIWSSTLGATPDVARRIDSPLLHAAPSQLPIITSSLFYQNYGDIVYGAIESVLKNAPPTFPRIAWCMESLSTEHLEVAKQSVLERVRVTIRSAIEAIKLLDWTGRDQIAEPRQLAEAKRAIEHMILYPRESIDYIETQDPQTLHQWFLDYLESRRGWQELLKQSKEVTGAFNSEQREGSV